MNDAIEGLNEIKGWSGQLNTTSYNVAGYIVAAMLGVSLVFVVWALANKKDNAKTYLIAWFVALIFTLIFILRQ